MHWKRAGFSGCNVRPLGDAADGTGDGGVDGCCLVGDVQQHDRLGDKSMARQRERVCV